MLKSQAKEAVNSQLCLLRPGVYTSASSVNPQRVVIKEPTPATIIEHRDDKFVIAMIDCQSLVLVHCDSIEDLS